MMQQLINQSLLIAHPHASDDFFSGSLVYVYEHQTSGSMGFMLNRQASIRLEKLMPTAPTSLCDQPDLIGGPVQTDHLFFIMVPLNEGSNPQIEIANNLDEAAANAEHPGQLVLPMVGYAGWSEGQLESEIQSDVWLLTEPNLPTLLRVPSERRYPAATESLGFDPALMAPSVRRPQ